MEPTEELGHSGWYLLKSWATSDGINAAAIYLHADVSIRLHPDGVIEEMGHPGWNEDCNQELLPCTVCTD
jgi:hypothetical protein